MNKQEIVALVDKEINYPVDFKIETGGKNFTVKAISPDGEEFIKTYGDLYKEKGFVVDDGRMELHYQNGFRERFTVPNFIWELCDHELAASFSF